MQLMFILPFGDCGWGFVHHSPEGTTALLPKATIIFKDKPLPPSALKLWEAGDGQRSQS